METDLDRPLLNRYPALRSQVPWVPLGAFPTPVEPLTVASAESGAGLWIKRDDRSAAVYGGNKVRTLEVLCADARRQGASHILSTGAYGSNHATATVLHAPRAGLEGGALLFGQPPSAAAAANFRVLLAHSAELTLIRHWAELPGSAWSLNRRLRARGLKAVIMPPGGATPLGALGYLSAAFELAEQVERGDCPLPSEVVIGVGSTCTSAGLLLGFQLAARLGVGFVRNGRPAPPRLVAVRVTPWPVTSATAIVALAWQTGQLLARLTRGRVSPPGLARLFGGLRVEGGFLGSGYGHLTATGRAAMGLLARDAIAVDTVYGAKSAAGLLARARHARGPLIYWATKSSVPLPSASPEATRPVPAGAQRWLTAADRYAALWEPQREPGPLSWALRRARVVAPSVPPR